MAQKAKDNEHICPYCETLLAKWRTLNLCSLCEKVMCWTCYVSHLKISHDDELEWLRHHGEDIGEW